MARVTADTNVLVSAAISRGPPRQLAYLFASGKETLVLSPAILLELFEILRRPKFRLSTLEVHRIVSAIVDTAEIVEPVSIVDVIEADPDDNAVLAAAMDGRADFIVSGDRHLLALRNFQGIPIRTVSDFLSARD